MDAAVAEAALLLEEMPSAALVFLGAYVVTSFVMIATMCHARWTEKHAAVAAAEPPLAPRRRAAARAARAARPAPVPPAPPAPVAPVPHASQCATRAELAGRIARREAQALVMLEHVDEVFGLQRWENEAATYDEAVLRAQRRALAARGAPELVGAGLYIGKTTVRGFARRFQAHRASRKRDCIVVMVQLARLSDTDAQRLMGAGITGEKLAQMLERDIVDRLRIDGVALENVARGGGGGQAHAPSPGVVYARLTLYLPPQDT
jgi:hypothetical protein